MIRTWLYRVGCASGIQDIQITSENDVRKNVNIRQHVGKCGFNCMSNLTYFIACHIGSNIDEKRSQHTTSSKLHGGQTYDQNMTSINNVETTQITLTEPLPD